jgi:outer membrane protein insertion porin family
VTFTALPALAVIAISAFAQAHDGDGPNDQPRQPPQTEESACLNRDANAANITLQFKWPRKICMRLNGGFSSIPGSFAGLSVSTGNLLHLGERLSLSSQFGVRLRRLQFGFDKPALLGKPIQTGFTIYGQRFNYNQARESSIFAFQRDIPLFNQARPEDLLNYVSHGYGASVFAQYPIRRSFSRVGLTYSYDVSDIKPLTRTTSEYYGYLVFQGAWGSNTLNGIRTSMLIPAFTYNTVDHPITPTRGTALSVSMAVAGLGGDVNTIEPAIGAKYFRAGFKEGHVIRVHLFGRLLTGYGGHVAPPFNRYYMGGENDVRGFDSWSVGPIAFLPSSATVNVLNQDGSPRIQKIIVNGVQSFVNVTQEIPVFRLVSPGGDTNVVANVEYRIPIARPVTLALFTDAGVNRLTFPGPLRLNPGRVDLLNAYFPQAGFSGRLFIPPGTQKVRMSTGAELQVRVPRMNAPLRFYGAYNPLVYRGAPGAPPPFDRSLFPNDTTYLNAVQTVGAPTSFRERRFMFRLSIGRTF